MNTVQMHQEETPEAPKEVLLKPIVEKLNIFDLKRWISKTLLI